MQNYLREVDRIILDNRDYLNSLETVLMPLLSKVSDEAKGFINEFIDKWDNAIKEDGLLSNYATTAKVLCIFIEYYSSYPGFSNTILYSDIQRFLEVQAKEKDNDWYKSKAEATVLSDIGVLRFCYSFWN